MKKKRIKKLLGVSLASIMLTGFIPTNANAVTGSKENDALDLIRGLSQGEDESLKLNSKKIEKDVDIETDEKVSIIVQFITDPIENKDNTAMAAFGLSKVDRDHEAFKSFLAGIPEAADSDGGIEINYEYTEVYNGIALDIKGKDIPKLLECDVVTNIYSDNIVTIDPEDDESYEIDTTMIDSLPFLNIDDLHDEGINGEGIKVGVIDTGIDYNHPDLTNAYCGFRASDGDSTSQNINSVMGWDFVDNDADPMETTYEDWQASGEEEFDYYGNAYYTEHGTHVSGTIAATGENTLGEYSITGVAPNVDLYGYRVLGPRGSGSTSAILAGIEKSVVDGMDVINLSLGNSYVNDTNDPMVDAVNNAILSGVVTVIAAGNSGPNSFTVGTPGTAALPIVVGASSVEYSVDTYEIKIAGSNEAITGNHVIKDMNSNIEEVLSKELELVYCGLGSTEDFANVNVKGKIAVIDRGDITFVEKASNAKANGAVLSILINNDDSSEIPFIGEGAGINTIAISKEDGDKLKESLEEKTVSIQKNGQIIVAGDQLAEFSSVGPVAQSFDIRPDLVAPGVQVLSTLPEYINNPDTTTDDYSVAYGRLSGTSMATPHVAGIAALILQANPDYSPEDVKAALMNTSDRIYSDNGTSYSVNEIGAGRVNAYEAVHEKVKIKASYTVKNGVNDDELENVTGMISFGKIVMNEGEAVERNVPITITNDTSENKSYKINIEYLNNNRCDDSTVAGVVLKTPSEIDVPAGSSKEFNVVLNVPDGAYGSYEGYINITDNDGENTYGIPYSAVCKKSGFEELFYPTDGYGYGQGLSAFTSAMLYNREPATAYAYSDITFTMLVNEEVDYVHGFVKDYETGEYIGYAGGEDGYWIPAGTEVLIQNFVPNGRVREIKNGNITDNQFLLEDGIYELEVVVETTDGNSFSGSLPMGIINDERYDTLTTDNVKPGITEISDDMFTTKAWYDGQEYEAIWINGHISNSMVDEMKNNYGMDYLKQGQVNMVLATYNNPGDEFTHYLNTITEDNGDFTLAGIEKSDFEKGYFKFMLSESNVARIMAVPENYILVDPSRQYLSIDTESEKVSEENPIDLAISLNNAENITEGSFIITDEYGDINSKIKICPSEELNNLLEKNGNKLELQYTNEDGVCTVNFKIISDSEEVKGLNGDIKLFDLNYSVESFKGVDKALMENQNMLYITLVGSNGVFKNADGNEVDVIAETMEKSIEVEHKNRTLIYGYGSTYYRSMTKGNIYAKDEEGNIYKPDYSKQADWGGDKYFTFNNLPVIDGYYTIVFEVPGSFDSIMKVQGGQKNKDGELVGSSVSLTSSNFFVKGGITSITGDVNNDGVIDIYDLNEVVKLYGQSSDVNTNKDYCVDLSQDGVIDNNDIEIILYNYLKQDYNREDAKIPEEYIDGKDYIDLLLEIGYYDDYVMGEDIKVSIDKNEATVGDTINIKADIYLDGEYKEGEYGEYQYQFLVKNIEDSNWNQLSTGYLSSTTWTPDKAGNYEIKARVMNQYGAILQDTISCVINDNSNQEPENPENPEVPEEPGNPEVPEKPGNPDDSNNPTKPSDPEDNNQGNIDNDNSGDSDDNSSQAGENVDHEKPNGSDTNISADKDSVNGNTVTVDPNNGEENAMPVTGGKNVLFELIFAGVCIGAGLKYKNKKK